MFLMPQKEVTAQDNLLALAVIGGFVAFYFCAAIFGWDVDKIFDKILMWMGGAFLLIYGPPAIIIMAVLVLLLYIFRPILVVIFSIFLPRSAISAIVRRFRVEPPP